MLPVGFEQIQKKSRLGSQLLSLPNIPRKERPLLSKRHKVQLDLGLAVLFRRYQLRHTIILTHIKS